MTDQIDDVNEPDEVLRSQLGSVQPPAELEARVTATLQKAGLVAGLPQRRRVWSHPVFAVAAGLLLFIAGLGARSAWDSLRPQASNHGERFALLLYEGDTQPLLEDDVSAHRLWAAKLAESGHDISGEKLSSRKLELAATADDGLPASIPDLQGFFIISAASEAEAAAIARSSPHFQHGGLVVVKKIDPT